MRVEDPARFVRELKGAPLSIVVLLMMTRQAMSHQLLCGGTGYSDKTVSAGIDYLEQVGMVRRVAGGWRIAEGVQLALPVDGQEEIEPGDGQEELTSGDEDEERLKSRKNSDFSPIGSSSSNLNLKINDLTTTTYTTGAEKLRFSENLRVMQECGIHLTAKTRELAGREYVNALYILGHVDQARLEKQQIGLAIWRMCEGIPRDVGRMTNGHLEGCRCVRCGYGLQQHMMQEEEEWEWYKNRFDNPYIIDEDKETEGAGKAEPSKTR